MVAKVAVAVAVAVVVAMAAVAAAVAVAGQSQRLMPDITSFTKGWFKFFHPQRMLL